MLVQKVALPASVVSLVQSLSGQVVSHIEVQDGMFVDIHCVDGTVVGFMPWETTVRYPDEEFWCDIKHPRIINQPYCDESTRKNPHHGGTRILTARGKIKSIWALQTTISRYEVGPAKPGHDPIGCSAYHEISPDIREISDDLFGCGTVHPAFIPDEADYVLADVGFVFDVDGIAVNTSTLDNTWRIDPDALTMAGMDQSPFKHQYKICRIS